METLQEAGVPPDLQGIVASLHANSRYTVRAQQESCTVESTARLYTSSYSFLHANGQAFPRIGDGCRLGKHHEMSNRIRRRHDSAL